MIKAGGTALLGLGWGGCARSRQSRRDVGIPLRSRLNLAPVTVSWDRVIRTTVGLRPHRPTGFNVKVEKLDVKTIVHNYGHGGAGHSLGWGTGYLAAELALAHDDRRAAVIGCGTVGLTAARQLQRRGFEVTIYTMAMPPDTTSNMAVAAFTPTSGLISAEISPEWAVQFRRAVEIAYRELQLLASPRYGISWIDRYDTNDTPPAEQEANPDASQANALLPGGVRTSADREVFGPGEHPFPSKYAIRRQAIRIEPSVYLNALVRDVVLFGGRLVIRRFDAPRDLMTLSERLIVNCSGLGSRRLFSDETMIPVKGQLVVLVPQPEINYACRAMPRSDGIALGGARRLDARTQRGGTHPRRGRLHQVLQRNARPRSRRTADEFRGATAAPGGRELLRPGLVNDCEPAANANHPSPAVVANSPACGPPVISTRAPLTRLKALSLMDPWHDPPADGMGEAGDPGAWDPSGVGDTSVD